MLAAVSGLAYALATTMHLEVLQIANLWLMSPLLDEVVAALSICLNGFVSQFQKSRIFFKGLPGLLPAPARHSVGAALGARRRPQNHDIHLLPAAECAASPGVLPSDPLAICTVACLCALQVGMRILNCHHAMRQQVAARTSKRSTP